MRPLKSPWMWPETLLAIMCCALLAGCDESPFAKPAVNRSTGNTVKVIETVPRCLIFPSSDKLPENVLKFYVSFYDQPMSRGEAYQRVKILDSEGIAIENPFLEVPEELWNSKQTRITLIIDPGRIKRGLKPNIEDGPVFEMGKTYELVVDGEWHAADGRPIGEGDRKKFTIVSADHQRPDPALWKIHSPKLGEEVGHPVLIEGKQQLVEPCSVIVEFDEPLDQALVERMIHVVDQSSKLILGSVVCMERQQTAVFTRENYEPLDPGKYKLVIDTALEDLAGNSIAKPFEVDLFEKVDDAPPTPKFVELEFEVK